MKDRTLDIPSLGTSNIYVSVIIPVFNDSKRLKICLEALENQTYPKHLYEVIVVDNGSDESIDIMVDKFSQAVSTYENFPGSYAARNKGIFLAKGDIIAFTDADCIPDSDWIEKGVANLLRVPNCGLVAGKIKLFFQKPQRPTAAELYDYVMVNFHQDENIKIRRYGVTANLFTFRHVIEDVGCFDRTLKSNGDREWGQRVFLAGYQQIYAEDACVAHPARYSLKETYQRTVRITGGRHDMKKKKGYPITEFIKDIIQDFLPPFRLYFRIWSEKRLKNSQQKIQVIFVALFVKYVRFLERIRLLLGGESIRN